jgi:hypothetical protein
MTTFNHSRFTDTIGHLGALLDQFPAGCDPEFDDGLEELERQFAELRLTFDHH